MLDQGEFAMARSRSYARPLPGLSPNDPPLRTCPNPHVANKNDLEIVNIRTRSPNNLKRLT